MPAVPADDVAADLGAEAELEAPAEGAAQVPRRDGYDHRAAGESDQCRRADRDAARCTESRCGVQEAVGHLVRDLDAVEAERLGTPGEGSQMLVGHLEVGAGPDLHDSINLVDAARGSGGVPVGQNSTLRSTP